MQLAYSLQRPRPKILSHMRRRRTYSNVGGECSWKHTLFKYSNIFDDWNQKVSFQADNHSFFDVLFVYMPFLFRFFHIAKLRSSTMSLKPLKFAFHFGLLCAKEYCKFEAEPLWNIFPDVPGFTTLSNQTVGKMNYSNFKRSVVESIKEISISYSGALE